MARFDLVLESSKLGVRKPEPAFYALACERLAVEPAECVFLDDLGINLKPARDMGMTTIKVVTPEQALARARRAILGLDLDLTSPFLTRSVASPIGLVIDTAQELRDASRSEPGTSPP